MNYYSKKHLAIRCDFDVVFEFLHYKLLCFGTVYSLELPQKRVFRTVFKKYPVAFPKII